jgi:hypothetical protein
MDYEVYLRTEAFEFLRHRHSDARNRLLKLLHQLGRDPYRCGDFSERDRSGREIQVLVFPAIRDCILGRSRRQGTESDRRSIRGQIVRTNKRPWGAARASHVIFRVKSLAFVAFFWAECRRSRS